MSVMKKPSDYQQYLRSEAWRKVKLRYLRSARSKDCSICGEPWSNAMEFHHRTYERLGRERLSDLQVVCHGCHEAIHRFHKHSRLPLAKASAPRRVRAFLKKNP